MIPVRARVDSPITAFGVRPPMSPDHPMADAPCPACGGSLTEAPITMVFVGVDPGQRAEGKTWVSAGAVVVHADRAGVDPTADPDAVRVGSVSPTDPAALGEWLRALPLRTILRSRNWSPCQRGIGEEHIHRSPNREFPALYVLGDPYEITEGDEQIDQLVTYHAPFTVLALGTAQDGA